MALTSLRKWSKLSAWKDPDILNISFPINAPIYYQHIKKIAIGKMKIILQTLITE
jgi:hypothetical protein